VVEKLFLCSRALLWKATLDWAVRLEPASSLRSWFTWLSGRHTYPTMSLIASAALHSFSWSPHTHTHTHTHTHKQHPSPTVFRLQQSASQRTLSDEGSPPHLFRSLWFPRDAWILVNKVKVFTTKHNTWLVFKVWVKTWGSALPSRYTH